jgi:hypothetical protein
VWSPTRSEKVGTPAIEADASQKPQRVVDRKNTTTDKPTPTRMTWLVLNRTAPTKPQTIMAKYLA